jgi:hypothetical protein
LSESILEEHDQNASLVTNSNSEERIKRIITTLGELAMLSYRRITHRLFLLLQSIAFFKVREQVFLLLQVSWPCFPTVGLLTDSSFFFRALPSSR